MVQKSAYTDTKAHANECVLASSGPSNEANIFPGLIQYDVNRTMYKLIFDSTLKVIK